MRADPGMPDRRNWRRVPFAVRACRKNLDEQQPPDPGLAAASPLPALAHLGTQGAAAETGLAGDRPEGGADGQEVAHYFDHEDDGRETLSRMLETVPPELSNWAKMSRPGPG
jgi:hypothetical protein